jgi:hypothetical protein
MVPLSQTITFGFPANLTFSAEFTMTCKNMSNIQLEEKYNIEA